MGELLLKVSSDPAFDGNIITAIWDTKAQEVFSEQICSVKNQSRNTGGLYDTGTIADFLLESIYQYKFERQGNAVKRTDIATNKIDIVGDTPNEQGEYINVSLFVDRRLQHSGHKMFGSAGAEVWYGGEIKRTANNLSRVWDRIETDTAFLRNDFNKWPFTNAELSNFFVVPFENLNNTKAAQLSRPKIEIDKFGEGIIVAEREFFITWKDRVPRDARNLESKIRNKGLLIDGRNILSPFRESRDVKSRV